MQSNCLQQGSSRVNLAGFLPGHFLKTLLKPNIYEGYSRVSQPGQKCLFRTWLQPNIHAGYSGAAKPMLYEHVAVLPGDSCTSHRYRIAVLPISMTH